MAWTRSFLLVVLLTSFAASACRCRPPDEISEAYHRASAVVRGKVVQLTPVPARRGARATVEVRHAWKRPVRSRLKISSLDLCAYPLKKGEEYVLFLMEDGPDLVTTRCTGNQRAAEAGPALQWLHENGSASAVR
jgi:hypothetical protein